MRIPQLTFAVLGLLSPVFALDDAQVRTIDASGATLVVEAPSVGLDKNAVSLVGFVVRNVGKDPVAAFRVRVYVDGVSGGARGFVTRSFDRMLPPGERAGVSVPLDGWFIEKGHVLSVAITGARTTDGTWRDWPVQGPKPRAVVAPE